MLHLAGGVSIPGLTYLELRGSQRFRDTYQNALDAPNNMSESGDDLFGDGSGNVGGNALMNMFMQDDAKPFTNEHI